MAKINIHDNELVFNNIYYVDSINGDDTTGLANDKNKPFKNIYTCVDSASNGDCIFALNGIHRVSKTSGYGTGGIEDSGKELTFIGQPNKTTFLCDGINDNTARDHHAISTKNANTKIIDIIFDIEFGTRKERAGVSICGYNSLETKSQIYNCVFLSKSVVKPAIIYDNDNSSKITFKNCLFVNKNNEPFVTSYSGSKNVKIVDCGFNTVQPPDCEKINCVDNVIINTVYRIENNINNVGVYSGQYSWVVNEFLLKQNNQYYTIKPEFYSGGKFQPLTLEGGEQPNEIDYENFGFDDANDLLVPQDTKVIQGIDKGELGGGKYFEVELDNEMKKINNIENQQGDSLIPELTSNIDKGYEVSASGEQDERFRAWKVFDKKNGSYDCWKAYNSSTPQWIQIKLPIKKYVGKYSITSRGELYNFPIKSWRLEGSFDGVDWTILDEQKDVAMWGYNETREYKIKHITNDYLYYRIYITDKHEGAIDIGEIQFFLPSSIFLIQYNTQLYTFNGLNIVLSPSQELNQDNFMTNGFYSPEGISQEQWNNVFSDKADVKLLAYTDDLEETEIKAECEIEPFTPYDKLNDEFEIHMATR